jgi:CheY-like chemotaxis protein
MGTRKTFILIAEDDADDRFLLKTAFEENGYDDRIEFVENGVELLNYLKSIQGSDHASGSGYPGFIMLDLNMPKKDGREVLHEIKVHPVFKAIPVIVYTTTKNEAEVRKCYELGANSYIVKPARFDALLKTIDDLRNYWLITSTIPE